jgi:ubiquinone/menaquinone biosynthesis C-methylase UbiE
MQDEARREAMRPLNYEVMFDVEDDHWWFVGRRAIVLAQIEQALEAGRQNAEPGRQLKRILDIGCGTGATMDQLKRLGEVQGVDLSQIPLNYSRQRGHERVLCANATELPFENDSFDLVTALDVIEHLDDDVMGLREIRRVLKSDAPAIIFVPAFQILWGPNDDQSGHRRRYRINQLRESIERAGLSIERTSYANIAMFLPILIGRKILNFFGQKDQAENRINHPLINKLLAQIFSSEADWLRRHKLPFGVSIVCVVRKET